MNQIERIAKIRIEIKGKELTASQIKFLFDSQKQVVSLRQIQRDLKDVTLFLDPDEYLEISKENKTVFYSIVKQQKRSNHLSEDNLVYQTKFYTQIISEDIKKNLSIIKQAITHKKIISIHKIKNDETGDNASFESSLFQFYPIQIIFHRDTYYIGGWNPKWNVIQIFGVNQLEKVTLISKKFNFSKVASHFEQEFQKRFGVTKNINEEVYSIKVEMSLVLAGFIKSHHWHPSQKFTKKNNNVILHLTCGINRELIGWLFQWMYNIRIIEPELLKSYYERTIEEIRINCSSNKALMYRNIF